MIELWAGAECTVNRVGDAYRDQQALTGHADRENDIDLLAGLPIKALRVPLLWERAFTRGQAEWARWDRQLAKLQAMGIRPLAGLIHHGSGPEHRSLLDPEFATGLADHAAQVADRYPWITDWTPVNEPLTTARFSALYGLWYPHARDERLFWLALLNQVDAVRLAMAAIRRIVPEARLIQTEDLGRTYATAPVRDQAAFDNQRRWMTWDLLTGRVAQGHPLWQRLSAMGFGERLGAIADAPCPPGIIGINHYLTSDRFLDHRLERYDERLHGGSSRQRFADIEAVRVLNPPPDSLARAIDDCWQRYHLPIAITEVHNGSTRDEQLRWFDDAWRTATRARAAGVDLRAVTGWALFGADSWNSLLTGPGRYEPGAFDISAGAPRATAVARQLQQLGKQDGTVIGAIARAPGWWRRPIRFTAPVQQRPAPIADHKRQVDTLHRPDHPPLLIVGKRGTLARALVAACRLRGLPHVAMGRDTLDLTDPAMIDAALDRHRPWAVINASGWVDVDAAEGQEAPCHALNGEGAGAVARACTARDVPSVYFSSDLVFDGAAGSSYVESDTPNPLNAYGRSKVAGEALIAATGGRHLVARTAAFFWAESVHSFAMQVLTRAQRGETFGASDIVVSPTHVPDLAHAVLDLLIDGETGIWHLTHGEALGWDDFARQICAACGVDPVLVETVPASSMGWAAARPVHSGLASTRGAMMPPLADAVAALATAARVAAAA